jgi:hypothetical protein
MDIRAAHLIAVELMDQHGLASIWTIHWDRMKDVAGECDHTRKVLTFNPDALKFYNKHEVEQVILHEIAHALVGPGKGHGSKWKSVARSIGYSGEETVRAGGTGLADGMLKLTFIFGVITLVVPNPVTAVLFIVWLVFVVIAVVQTYRTPDTSDLGSS